jgi:tetratricopeptide (TPR) repeat protein
MTLLDLLDEAASTRVVTDVPAMSARLRFAHVLIRDTLYEGLTSVRRVRLHRRALEVLEGLHDDDSGVELSRLVHHAIGGGDYEKALRYAWRAGDRALCQLAYEEAARLYRTALEALDEGEPPDEAARCRLLLSVGEAEDCAGDRAAAQTAFLKAADGARRLGLRRELALAAIGYGGPIVWGRAGYDERLVPMLEEGLAAAGDEHPVLRVRLLARLAGALRDERARKRRDALSREAVELGRRTDDLAALAYALNGRAAAIMAPDTGEDVLALGTELRELGERIGDPERVAQACTHRSFGLLQAGDVRAAELDLELGMRLARQLGQPALLFLVGGAQAMVALAQGHFGRANEIQREAFRHGERVHRRAARTVGTMQRYTQCDFEGRLDELAADLEEVAADEPARPVFRCALAHLHARLGPAADSLRMLDDLTASNLAALPFDQEWLFGTSLLAETAATLRSAQAAGVLYRALSPWATLNVVDQAEGIRGSAARYLGLLATTLERWDDADRHFTEAARRNADMGLRPWLALTQDDHATMLQTRALPHDRPPAKALHDAALATYRKLGMTPRASYAGRAVSQRPDLPAAR